MPRIPLRTLLEIEVEVMRRLFRARAHLPVLRHVGEERRRRTLLRADNDEVGKRTVTKAWR